MKKRILCVLLVLSMLLGMILTQTSFAEDEAAMSFVDVKTDDWFYPYVKTVYDAGVMQGKGAGKFEPESEMTRAEVVTVLCRLSGDEYESIDDSYSARFSDVVMTEWYVDYINWAVKSGLVLGYNDGTFRPDAPILRQEIAVLFVKFFDYIDLPVEGTPLVDKFADEDSFEGWAVECIEALRVTGLIGGDDNKNFNPEDNASRAEIATILTRLLPRLEEEEPETTDPENTTAPEESAEPETTEPETTEPETTEPETTESEPDPGPLPADDGAYFRYEGDITEEVFSAWLYNEAAPESNYNTVKVEDYSNILEEFCALGPQDLLRRDVNVKFTAENGASVNRTYELVFKNTDIDPDDSIPDNIGVEYTHSSSGIKISYVQHIEDENGSIYGSGTGIHGFHETRVVRTENGTYATYNINDTGAPTDEHPLWFQGVSTTAIIKITDDGFKIIHTFEYPQSQSSHTPNILQGKDGIVYVTNIADDHEKYMESLNNIKEGVPGSELEGGAWLDMYVIDTNTDTVIHKASARSDFETSPLEDHGYGKSQPILDLEHGRIYALYNGGIIPGYIAWFIYDIETGEWNEECFTIELTSRRDYFNGYPDGNGGMTFVVQRNCSIDAYAEWFGIEFNQKNSFTWDGLYIYNIPDPTKEEYKEVPIRLSEYSTTEPNDVQKMSHYGYGGCTYMDDKGNIHVIYSHMAVINRWTTYHAVYDRDLNEIKNEPMTFSETQGGKYNQYAFGMTQGPCGKYYIIAQRANGNASFEIWSSDDGINFKKTVSKHELKTEDGSTIAFGKMSINNTRCNGQMDGIVPIVISGDNHGTSGGNNRYYYVVLELP